MFTACSPNMRGQGHVTKFVNLRLFHFLHTCQ